MENILIDETFTKFGYNVFDLTPSSGKLVIWKCQNCKINKDKKFRDAKKNTLCLKCSNKINANKDLEKRLEKLKEWHRNNDHPLLNTTRPNNVVEALRESSKNRVWTDKQRAAISEKTKGSNNPFYGKKHTEESLEKMRVAQIKNVKRGEQSNFYGKKQKHGKGSWFTSKSGKIYWMRSTWEVRYATYLDNNNIKWEYESHTFELGCFQHKSTYTPDFYIISQNKFVEIKGWWRDDAKEKYDCFVNSYPELTIELLLKEDLKKLNII
jgi:hypothetical protein